MCAELRINKILIYIVCDTLFQTTYKPKKEMKNYKSKVNLDPRVTYDAKKNLLIRLYIFFHQLSY